MYRCAKKLIQNSQPFVKKYQKTHRRSQRVIFCLTLYMFVDALKKVQQTAYVAMNSLSQPARISKHEG